MTLPTSPLVSAKWLKDNINVQNMVILDASIYADRSASFIEDQSCIPKALFFDFRKDFVDLESSYPNTIPPVQQFERNCQKLGITNQSIIVIYDNRGIYTSPRAWWLFKSMGHQLVYVLNGGLLAWKSQNFELSNLRTKSKINSDFKAYYQDDKIHLYNNILMIIDDPNHCIIDARSKGRFSGTEPEPRSEIESGHIRRSINLPYTKVLKNGFYRSEQELKVLFSEFNLVDKTIAFTCGSGVTACIILLAAELVLPNKKVLYDGSWTEWATKQKLFIA